MLVLLQCPHTQNITKPSPKVSAKLLRSTKQAPGPTRLIVQKPLTQLLFALPLLNLYIEES